MDYSNKQINHAIIKAISIFEITKKRDFETTLVKNNYSISLINEESEKFFKNYFYPEFRHLLFSNIKTESVKTFTKKIDTVFTFMLQNEKGEFFRHTKINVNQCDLFLFPIGIHFFSIDFSLENTTFNDVSNINFFIQKLDHNVFIMNDKNETFQWIDWIEQNCLNSIKILPKDPTDFVSVDAYSGSKFKIYNVIETTEELSQKNRLNLLYDLGCNARIGTAEGNGKDSPSDSYLNELLENKISVFQNYDILPLFDSFTVIGL